MMFENDWSPIDRYPWYLAKDGSYRINVWMALHKPIQLPDFIRYRAQGQMKMEDGVVYIRKALLDNLGGTDET